MSDTNPPAPVDPPPANWRTTWLSRRRLIAGGVGLGLVATTGAAYLLLRGPGSEDAPMVIDKAGTVVSGQTVDRPIVIAANNVTLQRMTVRAGGTAVITVRAGFTGAVVTDSDLHCTTRETDGIVPGHYSATRVNTFGCRHPFVYGPNAPATITNSRQDGRPYPTGTGTLNPDTVPTPTPSGTGGPASPQPQAPPTPLSYWPGPTTTGVPPGTPLRDSGSLNLRKDGQIVSGLNINGCVNVYARNVIIRKSRISCTSTVYALRTYPTARNLVVEDVEINGNRKGSTAVCCADYTLRRVNIHSVGDGPRLGDRTNVVDSWIHDLTRVGNSHNDSLQTTGGADIVVRHNRLDTYNASTRDPMNACLMIGSTIVPLVDNLLFEGNYCNGGNYSIGIRTDLTASNVVIRDNKYGRDYRYGVVARPNHPGITWDRLTNVWFDNGQPVPIR
ncbi:hypothetical protein GCM10027290_43000 [Micromonospora sonneratiae]|uniref:Right handed beta helix region n=1 Tax=Micromonospora sonneratiae TaxID=1184706 RepID=A0ABW3YJ00_9ACTN